MNLLLASLKTISSYKNCSESLKRDFCFGVHSLALASFLWYCTYKNMSKLIGKFRIRLSEQFSQSWAARLSETQNKLPEEGPDRIIRNFKCFHRNKQKLYFFFLSPQKAARNLISKIFNKYSYHDTMPTSY
jgi:hypothetical protein